MPLLRRLAAAALLVAAFAPLHRLLDPDRTGPAGRATRDAADVAWTLGISGTLILVTACWVWVRMVSGERVRLDRLGARLAAVVARPSDGGFALVVGASATVLASLIAWSVHLAGPTSVDEMAQLLHAAALGQGRLTVPVEGPPGAWMIQNGVLTDGGWASIYPPLHTLLLALGMAFGAAWLVGPVMTGAATGFVTLAAQRALGCVPGRTTGLLLLVSPFWLLLGASHLSHTTAAAGLALVAWAALRARDGGGAWIVLAGVGVGIAVCARPWVGLVCSTALLSAAWWPAGSWGWRRVRSAGTGTVVGGLPFAVLLFGWNAAVFGSPTRLGYSVAFGPAHGLGLHTDPWGNRYGLVEALGYSGADLLQLGVRLFESPLPVTVIIGVALLARVLPAGAGLFAAWVMGAIAANALYWHHGIHMGPRMLHESAPAWVALLVAGSVVFFRPDHPRAGSTEFRLARSGIVAAVLAGLALSPAALHGPRSTAAGIASASAVVRDAGLVAADQGPVVVFVHGSWASRVSARLAGAGMRRDSIETALRRNDICSVDRYARFRTAAGPEPTIDFEALPGSPAHLESRLLSEGNAVRVSPQVEPDPTCRREASSDRLGVLELELLAWQSLPGPDADVVFARDLGPAANLSVLEALNRTARVYVDSPNGGLMLDYDEGMELLWGGAAGIGVRGNTP